MKSFYKDTLKVVSLDEVCRMQQVNDGSFASVDLVLSCIWILTVAGS